MNGYLLRLRREGSQVQDQATPPPIWSSLGTCVVVNGSDKISRLCYNTCRKKRKFLDILRILHPKICDTIMFLYSIYVCQSFQNSHV